MHPAVAERIAEAAGWQKAGRGKPNLASDRHQRIRRSLELSGFNINRRLPGPRDSELLETCRCLMLLAARPVGSLRRASPGEKGSTQHNEGTEVR